MPGRTYPISFAISAIEDLEGICDWCSSQAAAAAGDSLVREVVAQVEQLAVFPESGRVVPEFDAPWLRELIVPPLRIVYRFDGERIRVVRVWRSERLMRPYEEGTT